MCIIRTSKIQLVNLFLFVNYFYYLIDINWYSTLFIQHSLLILNNMTNTNLYVVICLFLLYFIKIISIIRTIKIYKLVFWLHLIFTVAVKWNGVKQKAVIGG